MHPFLFSWDGLQLRVWGLFVSLGILAGTYLAYRLAKRSNFSPDWIMDFALYGVIAGLIGARTWEVVFSYERYNTSFWAPLKIWEGGMSIQGSIVGALLALIIYVYVKKINFWNMADICAPGLLLGQAVGRIGCLLNGCCPGVPTTSWLGVVYQPDTLAFALFGSQPLVPAEFIEGLIDFALVGILLLIGRRKWFPGFITCMFFLLYSMNRLIMEFFRSDSLIIGGMKVAQLTAVIMIVASLLLMWILKRYHERKCCRLD